MKTAGRVCIQALLYNNSYCVFDGMQFYIHAGRTDSIS